MSKVAAGWGRGTARPVETPRGSGRAGRYGAGLSAAAEAHQRGAGRPRFNGIPSRFCFFAVNVVVVVVDPSGNKAWNGWWQRVTQGERDA